MMVEGHKHLKTLVEHLQKSSPAMTEQAAFSFLDSFTVDRQDYIPILVHFGLLDALAHQLAGGAEEMMVQALRVMAVMCSHQSHSREAIGDHKEVSNHLKTILATESGGTFYVRVLPLLADIFRGGKKLQKLLGDKQYAAISRFVMTASQTAEEVKSGSAIVESLCVDNSKAQDAFRHGKLVSRFLDLWQQKESDPAFLAAALASLAALTLDNSKAAEDVGKAKLFPASLITALKSTDGAVQLGAVRLVHALSAGHAKRKKALLDAGVKAALQPLTAAASFPLSDAASKCISTLDETDSK